MQETSTNIRIPNEEDPSDVIRIEGDPAGVKKVKAELMEMVKKMVSVVIHLVWIYRTVNNVLSK